MKHGNKMLEDLDKTIKEEKDYYIEQISQNVKADKPVCFVPYKHFRNILLRDHFFDILMEDLKCRFDLIEPVFTAQISTDGFYVSFIQNYRKVDVAHWKNLMEEAELIEGVHNKLEVFYQIFDHLVFASDFTSEKFNILFFRNVFFSKLIYIQEFLEDHNKFCAESKFHELWEARKVFYRKRLLSIASYAKSLTFKSEEEKEACFSKIDTCIKTLYPTYEEV